MAARDRRPVVHAPVDRWQLLGELLQLRRSELGYRRRPAFVRDRGINIRLVTDIENAYRPNTFLTPTLRDIAQAYQVTYDSITAVLHGKQHALTPAPPGAGAGLPSSPMDEAREEAARPYVEPIFKRLDYLKEARGVDQPAGEQIAAEPDGTRITRVDGTPLMTADDIRVFDGSEGALSLEDRVWLVGDLHARRAARAAKPNAGATPA